MFGSKEPESCFLSTTMTTAVWLPPTTLSSAAPGPRVAFSAVGLLLRPILVLLAVRRR